MKAGVAPRVNDAIAWLREKGETGTVMEAKYLLDEADATCNFSRATLLKAKAELGIRSERQGHIWAWVWP